MAHSPDRWVVARRYAYACSAAAALTACIAFGPLASDILAFIPSNLKAVGGLLGTSHEKMTNEAIEELDKELFGITKLTKPMKKAKDQIADANMAVDKDQKTASKHVDGESFPEAQARIVGHVDAIVAALGNKNAEGARKELGSALHTLQDFYAHSNWIELGNSSPNAALGTKGATIPRLPRTTATCRDCTGGLPPITCPDCSGNLITSGLTSGYYGGEDPPFDVKPAGKCSHGGITDGSATGFFGQGINKDSTDCEFSPHNFLHGSAAAVAKEATKQFIRNLKTVGVTDRQMKLLLGVGPTLAIAIDTTGSMGSIIDGVKQQAIQIVDARLGTDEEPSKYVLSPFSDPDTGPVTVTTDVDEFKGAISSLFASGGDDCPELSQTGMLQGLSASDEGGDLFMFTDASAKDAGTAGAVSSLAASKDIHVYPILFGSCSPIDPSYVRVASESGGQVFFLSTADAGKITQLADFLVRSNAVNVLLINDTLTGTDKSYAVPVDSTMTRVTFSVTGSAAPVLKRPDGTTVSPGDPGVTILSFPQSFAWEFTSSGWVFGPVSGSGGKVFSIVGPATGAWTITAGGTGDVSVKVSGESDLDLTRFRFVEVGGRPGHQGYFPIDGLPLAGREGTFDAVVSGAFADPDFAFRTRAGDGLASLISTPVPETTDEFFGQVTPPGSPFLVYLTGHDATGAAFQRVLSATISPQTVRIDAPLAQDLTPGRTTTYVFKVTNVGASDTFAFSASDDQRYLAGIAPSSFTLDSGASVEVAVQLQTPSTASPGTTDTLTVTVQSTGASGARNFAVVTSDVGPNNQPPEVGAAAPSVGLLWPPNHDMADISIAGVTDPDGDPVTIQIDQIRQDEPTGGVGSGDTAPDGAGVGTATAQVRAERSGTGNGRVYTIMFTASDGRGGSAQGTVTVCVPHNAGGSCVDDGPLFDSTR